MDNPLLMNGLVVCHSENFFILDFRMDVPLTHADNSQDAEEFHNIILVPKEIVKTIREVISQNIKKYEEKFKKLPDKQEIIEIEKKDKKKEDYFG